MVFWLPKKKRTILLRQIEYFDQFQWPIDNLVSDLVKHKSRKREFRQRFFPGLVLCLIIMLAHFKISVLEWKNISKHWPDALAQLFLMIMLVHLNNMLNTNHKKKKKTGDLRFRICDLPESPPKFDCPPLYMSVPCLIIQNFQFFFRLFVWTLETLLFVMFKSAQQQILIMMINIVEHQTYRLIIF